MSNINSRRGDTVRMFLSLVDASDPRESKLGEITTDLISVPGQYCSKPAMVRENASSLNSSFDSGPPCGGARNGYFFPST
jgi:hypothetical protein